MRNKIKTLIITLMMTLTTIVIFPEEIKSINDPPGADSEIGLDLSYIYNTTYELSDIVNREDIYPPGTIAKGRFFGSDGEHEAAYKIALWMEEIGLWDPTIETYPDASYLELIKNETSYLYNNINFVLHDFNDQLDVLNMSLEIYNTTTGENDTIVDCYIQPRWNRTIWDTLLERRPNPLNRKFLWDNYDEKLLTYEFVEKELEFVPLDENCTMSKGFDYYFNITMDNHLNEIINNMSIVNITTLYENITEFLENDYNFTFEDLDENPENITNMPWYNDSIECITSGDYVLIGETTSFNPDAADITTWKEYKFDKLIINKIFERDWIFLEGLKGYLKMFFWYIKSRWTSGNRCLGIVLYEHEYNNDTYDNQNCPYLASIPIININHTLGMSIMNDIDNLRLNYTLNQSWNNSVKSYNVIGQINGTNPDETVMIGCLYDSFWNQGTADAAIGIGIMMSIAKYIQYLVDESEGEIRPRCNLKFVAFGGEEQGGRGAYAYEYNHRDDETLTEYIDLNQLGYLQEDPRQALTISCNKIVDVPLMYVLGEYTNFVERVDNVTGFDTALARKIDLTLFNESDDDNLLNPFSDNEPFNLASLPIIRLFTGRNVNTYLIIKEKDRSIPNNTGWLKHHRSGLNHTEGDSMKYYNHDEINITAELILNVTKYMVMNPDCWFDDITYVGLDTNEDELNDSVRVDFTVKPTIPHDRICIRAILRSDLLPLIASYMAKKDYIVTDVGISDSLVIDLPKWAPRGGYSLDIHLYNSTGDTYIESIDDVANYFIGVFECWQHPDILEKLKIGFNESKLLGRLFNCLYENVSLVSDRRFNLLISFLSLYKADPVRLVNIFDYIADNTYYPYLFVDEVKEFDDFDLFPCNHKPDIPNIIEGFTEIENTNISMFNAVTNDTDGDDIYYQWKWETKILGTIYTPWFLGGPYSSGEPCTQNIIWALPRNTPYKVRVRAKDSLLSSDTSGWSEPWYVNVSQGAGCQSGSSTFGMMSSNVVVLNQAVTGDGVSPSVNIAPHLRGELSWNWSLSDGTFHSDEDVVHNYTEIGNYTVNLTLTDDEGYMYNHTSIVSVVSLKSEFDYTVNTSGGSNLVVFDDISDGLFTLVNWSWDFGDGNISYDQNVDHFYSSPGMYNVTLEVMDNETNFHSHTQKIYIEEIEPSICNVTQSVYTVGTGANITVNASAFDVDSGLDVVLLNVSYPDNTFKDFEMILDDDSPNDYTYVFNDTWQSGSYYYGIVAYDNSSNMNCSVGYCFNVTTQATISVCSVENEYKTDKYINLTDPPIGSPMIGYELLEDDKILHIWNKYDSYYFNTSSGIQLTNHMDEYWSHNVLMLGYYNNDEWNLIYRTDELTGFNKNIDSDDETYVAATIWKDLNYNGYDFRLAIQYHLGVDDNELTVTPYIKNLDIVEIPYSLGFGWEMNNIQISSTVENDYIWLNNTENYLLNQTLNNTYTDLSEPIYWFNTSSNQTEITGYTDPAFYLQEDIDEDVQKSLYLRWDKDLTYTLQVKSRDGEYNAPVTLFILVGSLDVDQAKYTDMYWYDANQIVYYFNRYDEGDEEWSFKPSNMVDGDTEEFASSGINYDVELCNGNTYSSSPGGTISKVEIRAYGYNTGWFLTGIILCPVFDGEDDGDDHYFSLPDDEGSWSDWYNITNDTNASSSWSWNNISNLDCDVVKAPSGTAHCSKIEIRVTYNNDPAISNPIPADNTINVSISPMLSVNVSDADGNLMNITWLSNSSGSWIPFDTNCSVGNGTYSQKFTNASVNGEWWYWKVNVSDGDSFVESNVYKFYTGVQSKIVNTGSTNITGYLYIVVENLDDGKWVLDDETINETSTRTINAGDTFALDLIFNDLVSTGDLSHGDGTYRVYAAFRDEYYEPIVCDDDSVLEAWWEFTVNIV